ncbi:phage head closure protein [Bacillus safensis]|uniref:phage head closure protein n=1 Tax=Bacillus safensis TaxID=561879 RepID=UPI00383766CC
MAHNPGRRRHKIHIQHSVPGRNPETMKPVQEWVTHRMAWAEILQPKGNWVIQAAAQGQQNTVFFRIRHKETTDKTGTMRVLFAGKAYRIKSIMPDLQYKELMVIECVGWDHEDHSTSGGN